VPGVRGEPPRRCLVSLPPARANAQSCARAAHCMARSTSRSSHARRCRCTLPSRLAQRAVCTRSRGNGQPRTIPARRERARGEGASYPFRVWEVLIRHESPCPSQPGVQAEWGDAGSGLATGPQLCRGHCGATATRRAQPQRRARACARVAGGALSAAFESAWWGKPYNAKPAASSRSAGGRGRAPESVGWHGQFISISTTIQYYPVLSSKVRSTMPIKRLYSIFVSSI